MLQNRIKSLRLAAGLTQKQLADEFNQYIADQGLTVKPVSYAAISRWETGDNNPQDETWNVLAKYFKVDPGFLRGYSSSPYSDVHEMFQWIDSQELSDDATKDRAIKDAIESVYEDLSDKIRSLEEQIDEINYPGSHEDYE